MDEHNSEKQSYIEHRIRRVLAKKALNQIRKIVERIEADDKKARIGIYIFALLFAAGALTLILLITHTPR